MSRIFVDCCDDEEEVNNIDELTLALALIGKLIESTFLFCLDDVDDNNDFSFPIIGNMS